MQTYKEFWTKMLFWNSTATRTQYWIPWLINTSIVLIVGVITGYRVDMLGFRYPFHPVEHGSMFTIVVMLMWLAQFTLRARRFHDLNRSNWYILLYLVPVLGSVVAFILMLMPGVPNSRWPQNQSEAGRQ